MLHETDVAVLCVLYIHRTVFVICVDFKLELFDLRNDNL